MDPMIWSVVIAFIAELIAAPIIVSIINRKLNNFDEKREVARHERAEDKRRELKQREAERNIILAIARTMLLDNYEKCVDKGYYSVDEREIYHKLYVEYKNDGGNGIIDTIAARIKELPLEPPEDDGDNE